MEARLAAARKAAKADTQEDTDMAPQLTQLRASLKSATKKLGAAKLKVRDQSLAASGK